MAIGARGVRTITLDGDDWTLIGSQPNAWRLGKSKELGATMPALVPRCPARVPGSVQTDLIRAGELPDLNEGLNSRGAEWVEHLEWIYSREFAVPGDWSDAAVILEFDGLDYSGTVAIDGVPVGEFEGTHTPHAFDITTRVQPGASHTLSVAFDPSPRLPGQLAFTNRVTTYKPRYNYGWDWLARLVSVGIWDSVRLRAQSPLHFTSVTASSSLELLPSASLTGLIAIRAALAGYTGGQDVRLVWTLIPGAATDACAQVRAGGASGEQWVVRSEDTYHVAVPNPALWWPNGVGDPCFYTLRVELQVACDVTDVWEASLGFRDLEWVPTPGAPANARPSTLCAGRLSSLASPDSGPGDGTRLVYLRGANWVPLTPFPGTATPAEYRKAVQQHKAMNVNILRVWGGAVLERRGFYDACDEAGIMVWQEFPLSSGGCSDYPPDDSETIALLTRISTSMVQRRGHHPCHILWGGGNELAEGFDGSQTGREVPIDTDHPLIGALERQVREWDPGKRFIPTSGHGPRAFGLEADYGKGVHHDVHGHWAYLGPEDHYRYYNGDDAIWRSEVGVPGATSLALTKALAGGLPAWPPDASSRLWLHHGAWWMQWEAMNAHFGPWSEGDEGQLASYLACSRYLQFEGYRYVLESCRRRAFRCSLNTIWMGRDCFWTTCNNSVVEVDGSPKPAWSACQRAFGPLKASLRYDRLWLTPGQPFPLSVWALCDEAGLSQGAATRPGLLTVALHLPDGAVLWSHSQEVDTPTHGSAQVWEGAIDALQLDPTAGVFVRVSLVSGGQSSSDTYAFGASPEHPLAWLRALPPPGLSVAASASSPRGYSALGNPAATSSGAAGREPLNIVPTRADGASLTQAPSDGTGSALGALGFPQVALTVLNSGPVAAVLSEVSPAEVPGFVVTMGNAITLLPGERASVMVWGAPGEPLPRLKVACINDAIGQEITGTVRDAMGLHG